MAKAGVDKHVQLLRGIKEKILTKLTGMLGGIEDPYAFNKGDSVKHDERLWPCVEYPDIYNYLVTTPSSYIYQRSTEGL